ncbi:hypothetical protein EI94DRAFT_1725584 [Lactarius quietus]|nr:hypothetical protein EI94DRAFT_1725584 [Lactarius quietus]
MQPPFIGHPSMRVRHVCVKSMAPQERGSRDILEEEGEKKFKSMVEEIKQACAAL